MEPGVRFNGELVARNVLGSAGDGLLYIDSRMSDVLVREAEHQIEIDIVEAGLLGGGNRRQRLGAGMDAPQGVQMSVVKSLYTDRQAVDTGTPVVTEFSGVGAAGVRLQGHFQIRYTRDVSLDLIEQPRNGRRRQ